MAPPPSFFERLIIRMLNLPVEALGRLLDVGVLLVRPRLLGAYLRLWYRELRRSPYRWPRGFETLRLLKATGQEVEELVYGELPVASALWLFFRAGLRRGGSLLDLGAGRGRPLLAARLLGASAVGVELLPAHVDAVADLHREIGSQLLAGDMKSAELGAPGHVLLNWCGLQPATRGQVQERLVELAPGTVLLAVGVPLQGPHFRARGSRLTLFTWGLARVHVFERTAL